MCVGFILLPKVIWSMYEMMYTMPEISISFNTQYGITGLLIASVCIIGATIYSTIKELKQTPASLMRPKSPKMGKRVLLERFTFLWKRLTFLQKVTVRNIFRYKKRFLMTIIGICGCTALILAGFGLRDSISHILSDQYENVFDYDMMISLKNDLEKNQVQNIVNTIKQTEECDDVIQTYMTSGNIISNFKQEKEMQIIIPKQEQGFSEVIRLQEEETKEPISMQKDKILVSNKLAELLEINVGDTITIKNADDIEKQVTVGNIVDNYIGHYVYMSQELYKTLYGDCDTNILLAKNINLSEDQEDEFAQKIMEQKEVSGVTLTSTIMTVMDDTLSSLNYVVGVLIISAGLLAFVVLYNLASVNISERVRELATIKVLGFYDREVYTYITRETILLTIIGIVLGLIGGYFLNIFILGTCELDTLHFSKIIEPISYVFAVIITLIFTVIVNIATYFALKKIDMIESLKSIE